MFYPCVLHTEAMKDFFFNLCDSIDEKKEMEVIIFKIKWVYSISYVKYYKS